YRLDLSPGSCMPLEALLQALTILPLDSIYSSSIRGNALYFDSEGIDSVAPNCVKIHGLRKRKPSGEFGARRLRIPFLVQSSRPRLTRTLPPGRGSETPAQYAPPHTPEDLRGTQQLA